jgi:fructan beta-fructosidase
MSKTKIFRLLILLLLSPCVMHAQDKETYNEAYRPQVHFSPAAHWTNDPNGMVYYKGVYHLFFQYYPGAIIWGPMHWGHAISKDLVHWKQLPIALYPDSLGYIFSGSAVVDYNNTSGFGKDGKVPLVAIFTHHDPKGEKAGRNDFQNESLAYSLDEGNTWTKYSGNPVLKNPGIRDFRDPKVSWYAPGHKWVMTLATQDHITFFSSPDLKNWKKESEFGKELGAHGGVWECPDLFPLKLNGKEYWVLIVNVNPGGPNGGSATQYFVGQFDGNKFITNDNKTKWADYGPDEYAGITWSNTGDRKIFLGWMSNWEYANQVPTEKWRNAMTLPRDMKLKDVNGNILLASTPVNELKNDYSQAHSFKNVTVNKQLNISAKVGSIPGQYVVKMNIQQLKSYEITLSNAQNERLLIGYDSEKKQYYIDRTKSGKTDFQKDFSGRFVAPRLANTASSDITLVVDKASVELFADKGLTVMTAIYFAGADLNHITLQTPGKFSITGLEFMELKSIWQ